MNFQRGVLIIATLVLLGVLTFIGMSMYSKASSSVYPPTVASCPDYWEAEPNNGDPTNPICKNNKNVGSENCPTTMNFNTNEYIGDGGFCAKKKWANNCDLSWDGVTNSNRQC
jgi:hypothetical protein